jgi:transposase
MLSQQIIDQLQPYDFDRLARKEPDGRRRLRLIALAHLKEGKSCREVSAALHACRHAVMRWVQWFIAGGVARLAGMPHDWSTQRLAKAQEEAFRQAVEQLQCECGGGRVRGEDIRQLLARQFGVAYSLSGVYDLMKRLGMVWISARTVSSSADPVAQAEFKKNVTTQAIFTSRMLLTRGRAEAVRL